MKRICDSCGKEKEKLGGKTCEQGHFICKTCVSQRVGVFDAVVLGSKPTCPLDGKPLR
jgi:transposase-like protein